MTSCSFVIYMFMFLSWVEAHPTLSLIECDCSSTEPYSTPDWLETDVVAGFRIWQLLFLSIGGFIVLVVLLCCVVKIRIPRTKQEIEIDYQRKWLTRNFRAHLDMLSMGEVNFVTVLDKVKEICNEDNMCESECSDIINTGAELPDEEIQTDKVADNTELEIYEKPSRTIQFVEDKQQLTVPYV
ncbi:uncharacterized protein LOC143246021 [Tachypleus tridentatus]|uniref:uncharacterized protein LOC143246021 n=1 Tax=Tachypleus tridentatus TaxID=6853 RepID=UPI003FCF3E54